MGTTSKRGIRYPDGTAIANTLHTRIQELALDVEEQIDLTEAASNFYAKTNLAYFQEKAANLSGYLLVQTNIGWDNTMARIAIRGFVNQSNNNIIDLVVTLFTDSTGPTIVNAECLNQGNHHMNVVGVYVNTTTNKIALVLQTAATSNQWQYPKLWVDAIFANSAPSTVGDGWMITRVTSLTGYTLLTTPKNLRPAQADSGWTAVSSFLNSWVNFGGATWNDARYRRKGNRVYLEGMVKSGTVGTGSGGDVFQLPADYRPSVNLSFAVMSNNAFGRLDVYSTGAVRAAVGNNASFSLSGTAFFID